MWPFARPPDTEPLHVSALLLMYTPGCTDDATGYAAGLQDARLLALSQNMIVVGVNHRCHYTP